MSGKGMGGHQSAKAKSIDWLTPPWLVQALGPFDTDPCASVYQPWRTAATQYTVNDNGLLLPWEGRVWLNPPYGDAAAEWLRLLSQQGNGIALIFGLFETAMYFNYVWPKASSYMIPEGRLHFYGVFDSKHKGTESQSWKGKEYHTGDGKLVAIAEANSGAPSAIIDAFKKRVLNPVEGIELIGWTCPKGSRYEWCKHSDASCEAFESVDLITWSPYGNVKHKFFGIIWAIKNNYKPIYRFSK